MGAAAFQAEGKAGKEAELGLLGEPNEHWGKVGVRSGRSAGKARSGPAFRNIN